MSAKKPPIGISLARTMGDHITEQSVCAAADAIVSRGLAAAGYEYLIIGDGAFAKRRDRSTGALAIDEAKFPRGLEYVSDYLHSKGLKLGVLTSGGAATVNGAPGCLNHEYGDARTLAAWGVDYISHDTAYMPPRADIQTMIRRMGMALRACGRDIIYSVFSTEEKLHVWARGAGAGAYCGRLFSDAGEATYPSETIAGYSADYCWHNCGEINVNASLETVRRQMVTAAIMSSPIIVDCDVAALSDDAVALLCSSQLLAVSQDDEGRPARRFAEGVYCKYLENAEYAVAFINTCDEAEKLEFYAHDFGITWNAGYALSAECVCGGADEAEFDAVFSTVVPAGDAKLYKLRLV